MFAQRNYPQHLGNSGYSIAEVGCLLTSICNLLIKFDGTAPDPPTLNQHFLEQGAFIWDGADRANDDLAWNSISRYDGNVQVAQVGAGPVPPSNNAIVKFHYTGIHTGQPVDHYCAVDHIDGNRVYIVDSWDGIVKAPEAYESVYHKPIAWAVYVKNVPIAPPPVAAPPIVNTPPAAPIPFPSSSEQYSIIKTILGFPTATTAGNHVKATGTVAPGNYYIFNKYPNRANLINVSKKQGQPGSWINTDDNVVDSTPPPAPEPIAPAAPVETAPNPNQWKASYQAYKDVSGQPAPKTFVIMWDVTPIFNADSGETRNITKGPDGKPAKYENIQIAGMVTKDNVTYYRPQKNNTDKGLWWLIPEHDPLGRHYLLPETEVYNSTTSTAERLALKQGTWLDKLAKAFDDASTRITKIKVK